MAASVGAGANGARDGYNGKDPNQNVEAEEEGGIDVKAEEVVEEGEDEATADDYCHCKTRRHSHGEEFVMYVAPVRHKGIATSLNKVHKHADHIAAGYEQWRECQHSRIHV